MVRCSPFLNGVVSSWVRQERGDPVDIPRSHAPRGAESALAVPPLAGQNVPLVSRKVHELPRPRLPEPLLHPFVRLQFLPGHVVLLTLELEIHDSSLLCSPSERSLHRSQGPYTGRGGEDGGTLASPIFSGAQGPSRETVLPAAGVARSARRFPPEPALYPASPSPSAGTPFRGPGTSP